MPEDFTFSELDAARFETPREHEIRAAFDALEQMNVAEIADFVPDGVISWHKLELIPHSLDEDESLTAHTKILKARLAANIGIKPAHTHEPGNDVEWEMYSNLTVRFTTMDRGAKDPVHIMTYYDTPSGELSAVHLINNETMRTEIESIHRQRATQAVNKRLQHELGMPESVISGALSLEEKQQFLHDYDLIKREQATAVIDPEVVGKLRKKALKSMIPLLPFVGVDATGSDATTEYISYITETLAKLDIDRETLVDVIKAERQTRLLQLDERMDKKVRNKSIIVGTRLAVAHFTVTFAAALSGRMAESAGVPYIDSMTGSAIGSVSMLALCLQSYINYTNRQNRLLGFKILPPSYDLQHQLEQESIIVTHDLRTLKTI